MDSIDDLTEALLRIAAGDFEARTRRTYTGEPLDVVACLVDNMADELSGLFEEKERLEREVQEAARLAAVGQLAAGVAHEINNPLAHLSLNLRWLRDGLDDGGPAGRSLAVLETCQQAVARIGRIVQDLMAFGRPVEDGLRTAAVSLAEAVAVAVAVVEPTTRHRVALDVQIPPDLTVLADPDRLTQAVVNLLLNAAQAYDRADPVTQRVHVSGQGRDGRGWLRIVDWGAGISPDRLEKIFEPFVTGRRDDGGTGLGLSVSRTLIDAMGGSISARSHPQRGTEFLVELALQEPASAPRPKSGPTQAPVCGLVPRVLVVDDEPEIRNAVRRSLRRRAEVVLAQDGQDALERLREGRFDLVLCDLVMPRLDGAECWRRARAEHDWLDGRWVFMTGGSFTGAGGACPSLAELPVLRKPFDLEDLLALLPAPRAARAQ